MNNYLDNAYKCGYAAGLNKVAGLGIGDALNIAFTLPGLVDSAKHYIDKAEEASKKHTGNVYQGLRGM